MTHASLLRGAFDLTLHIATERRTRDVDPFRLPRRRVAGTRGRAREGMHEAGGHGAGGAMPDVAIDVMAPGGP
jgi:hypothetical protein